MPTPDAKLLDCPALLTIRVISGKWKTRILWLLREREHHFGELRRALPGVSAKVLTDHLRALEADGIVTSRTDQRGGVTYSVFAYTDYGRSLIPALDALGQWGLDHAKRS